MAPDVMVSCAYDDDQADQLCVGLVAALSSDDVPLLGSAYHHLHVQHNTITHTHTHGHTRDTSAALHTCVSASCSFVS